MPHDDYALPIGSRPIAKAPGYRITNVGIVWSSRSRNGQGDSVAWRVMKPRKPNRSGHIQIGLRVNNKYWQPYIHQLVLEVFEGPCPPGKEVRHKDGNPANNSIENLKYGTQKDNADDRERHGRTARGEKNAACKLTEATVCEIFHLRHDGLNKVQISRKIGVDATQVSRILRRELWSHVPIPSGCLSEERRATGNIGEGNASAKLKESDIPEIFRLWRGGRTKADIAKILHVSDGLISKVTLCQIWTHVPV